MFESESLPVSGSLAIEKLLVHLQKNKNFTKEDFISKVNIIHGISNSFHWQTIYRESIRPRHKLKCQALVIKTTKTLWKQALGFKIFMERVLMITNQNF